MEVDPLAQAGDVLRAVILDARDFIKSGQLIAPKRDRGDTREKSVAIEDFARKLKRALMGDTPCHRLADEQQVSFRIELGAKMLTIRQIDPPPLQSHRVLRQHTGAVDDPGLEQLPGVSAVWASAVTNVGKYGFLRPGARTRSAVASPKGFALAVTAE